MLTAGQERALAFIRRYCLAHGRSPSLAEIAAGIGIRSRGVAHRHVQALAEAGHIRLLPNRKRGIALTGEDVEGAFTLPLVGRIAAGQPIAAISGEDTLNLTDFILGPRRYALRVLGESMVGIGIMHGDTVVVEQADSARDGEIVVALIDGEEATLKRLKRRRDGHVELIAENPAMPNLIYPAERVRIQGVVVAALRSYR